MKPNTPSPQPSRKLQSRKLIAGFFLGLLLNPAAQATNDTWTGLGNDNNLTNALNWVGGVAPVAGDSLFFTGNSQLTPGSGGSFPTNTLFGGVLFDVTAGNYTLSGNLVILGGNLTNSSVVGSGVETISAPLALTNASPSVNVSSFAGMLSLSGVISETGGTGFGLAKTGSGLLTLSGANIYSGPVSVLGGVLAISSDGIMTTNQLGSGAAAVNLTLDGGTLRTTASTQLSTNRSILLGDAGAGTGGTIDVASGILTNINVIANNGGANNLIKTGQGTLTLGGTNTYTGNTVVNQGILNLDFNQAGTPTANIISSSSPLVMSGLMTSLGNPNAGGTTAQTIGSAYNVTAQLGATSVSAQSNNGVTLNPGYAVISTTTNGTGNVLLNLGAITRNAGSSVNFRLAGTLTSINAIKTSTANDSTGILGPWATYNSTNWAANDGNGNITNYAGYVNIAASGTTISDGTASNVRINSGATGANTLSGSPTTNNINTLLQATTVKSTLNMAADDKLRLGVHGGIMQVPGSGVLQIGQTASQGVLTAGGNAGDVAGEISIQNYSTTSAGPTIYSRITDNGSGVVSLTIGGTQPNGSTIFQPWGSNSYSGGTIITSGRVNPQLATSLGTGPVTVYSGAQDFMNIGTFVNNFNIAGGGAPGNTLFDSPGALRLSGTSGSLTTLLTGTITLLNDAAINSRNTSGNVLAGQITGNYNLILTGSGANGGNIKISSTANNWTGNLIIDGKQLLLGNSEVIPNGAGYGNVVVNNNATSILDLNGFNETINGLISTGGNPFVQNNSNSTASTLTFGDGDASGTFRGIIRDNSGTGGTLALTKIGNGTEQLFGNNTFSGGLNIYSGIVFANANATCFGSGTITLGNTSGSANAILRISNVSRTYAQPLVINAGSSGTCTFDCLGAGQTFTYSGAMALNNSLNINTYSGSGNGDQLAFSGPITGNGTSPITVAANGGNVTLSGAISGSGTGITNAGTSTLFLQGANTFTDGLTINAGTVSRQGGGSGTEFGLGNITVNNGSLNLYGGGNIPLQNLSGTNGQIMDTVGGSSVVLTNSTDTIFAGLITANVSGGLTKTGNGMLTLSGANTYGGATAIEGGVLVVSNASSLGSSSSLAFNGGTLRYSSSNSVDYSALITGSSGPISIDTAGQDVTFATALNGGNSGGLVKAGSGMLTLSAAPGYSGSTIVSNGALSIISGVNGALSINSGATVFLSSGTSIGDAVSLAAGNAELNIQDHLVTTLNLNNGLTLNGGNILDLDLGPSTSDQLAIVGGSYTAPASGLVTINLENAGTGGGSVTYNLITGAAGITTNRFVLGTTIAGYNYSLSAAGGTLSVTVTAFLPGADYWRGGVNASWNTPDSGGNFNWATDGTGTTSTGFAPGAPTDVTFASVNAANLNTTLGANFGIRSLTFTTSGNVAISGANTLSIFNPAGITVQPGAGTDTINCSALMLGASQSWSNNASNPFTVSAAVTGPFALTLGGTGLIALSGANSFNGGTILNGTIVQAGSSSALGRGALTVSSGTLDVNGQNLAVGSLSGSGGTIIVNSNAIAASLVVTQTVANTYSGVIQDATGTVALTKTGSASLVLNTANTYSGGTTISAGTLALGDGSANGSVVGAIADNSSLSINPVSNQTVANTITGTGSVVMNGSVNVTLTASNTYAGGLIVSNGTVYVGNPNALGIGAGNIVSGTVDMSGTNVILYSGLLGSGSFVNVNNNPSGYTNTLTFANTNITTVSAYIQGPVALVKTNSGTVTINNANNNYVGGTTLNAGQITLGASSSGVNPVNNGPLGTSPLILSGGTLQFNHQTLGNNISVFTGTTTIIDNQTGDSFLDGNVSGAGTLVVQNSSANNLSLQVGFGVSGAPDWSGFTGTLNYNASASTANINIIYQYGADWYLTNATLNVTNTTGNGGSVFGMNTAYTAHIGALSGPNGFLTAAAGGGYELGALNTSTTFGGIIEGAAFVTKVGTGTLTLNGVNTFQGVLTIKNGAIAVTNVNNAAANGPLGANSVVLGDGISSTGTLAYNGSTASRSMPFTLATSSTGVFQINSNAANLTLSGLINGDGNLVKTGPGALTFSGANNYNGPTTVSNGTLTVSTVQTGDGTFTVNDGATLGVSVIGGGSLAASAVSLGVCTNSYSGLSSTVNPAITNSGALALNGTVTVNASGISAVGNYPLIASSSIGGAGGFVIGSLPSGIVGNIVTNGGTTIALNVTVVNSVVWSGSVNTNWDMTTANWTTNGGAVNYTDGSKVVFDDSSTKTNVMLITNVAPFSITMSNSTKNYTFTSPNGSVIGGADALVLNGSGTLTLTNLNNSYSGGTFINNGKLAVYADTNLGAIAPLTLNGGALSAAATFTLNAARALTVGPASGSGSGTLDVQTNVTFTVNNVISNNAAGNGSLIKTGPGTLTINGTNIYSGTTTLSNGTVVLGFNTTDLPVSSGPFSTNTVILAGGRLQFNAKTLGNNISVSPGTTTILDNTGGNSFLPGNVSGSGTMVIQNSSGNNLSLVVPNAGTPDWSGFTGTLNYNASASTAVINIIYQYGADWDLSHATVNLTNTVPNSASRLAMNGSSGLTARIGALSGPSGFLDGVVAGGNATFEIGALNTSTTFGGIIENLSGSAIVNKVGTGTLTLSGVSTFNGVLTIKNGAIAVATVNNVSTAGPLGNSANSVVLGDGVSSTGTLQYTGGTASSSKPFTLTSGSTGVFQITNNAATLSLSGLISDDGSGSATLVKTGPGALTFSAANSYSGATIVSNGTLTVSTVQTGGGTFTVKDGATLGVAVVGGGSLTASGVTLGNCTNNFSGVSSTVNPAINNGGALTLNGTVTVNLTSITTVGNYPLIASSSIGGTGGFVLSSLPLGAAATIVTNGGTTIALSVTGITNEFWTGNINTNWDMTTTNWTFSAGAVHYTDGALVVFDDSSTVTNVNLAANVAPASLTMSNSAENYTFISANGFGIGGAGALVINGSGSLTLKGGLANTYSGGTFINGGNLIVSTDGNMGSAAGALQLNGGQLTVTSGFASSRSLLLGAAGANTINVASSQILTYSGIAANLGAGAGTLVLAGGGELLFSAANNTYSGGTLITNGTLALGTDSGNLENVSSLGSGPVTVNGTNAQLRLGGASPLTYYTINNPITIGGNAAIDSIDGYQHLAGNLTVTNGGARLVTRYNGKDLSIDGTLSGSAPLTVDNISGAYGNGIVHITAAGNPYSGTITINGSSSGYAGGALELDDNNALTNATINDVGTRTDNTSFNSLVFASGVDSPTLGGLQGTATINLWDLGGSAVTLTVGGNNASTAFTGVLSDFSLGGALVKVGTGTLSLLGTNTYTGATTVSNGTLVVSTLFAGNGSFTVEDNAELSVTNAGGATTAEVSSLTLGDVGPTTLEFQNVANTTTPVITSAGALTVNGNSTIKITGTNGLVAGSTYPLVVASGGLVGTGGFALSLPTNVVANLVTNGGNTIALSVTSIITVNTNPTNITATVSDNVLTLVWPADHLGWHLQAQTNSLSNGLGTNWVTIPNTDLSNSYTNTINPANGTVFYRMVYP